MKCFMRKKSWAWHHPPFFFFPFCTEPASESSGAAAGFALAPEFGIIELPRNLFYVWILVVEVLAFYQKISQKNQRTPLQLDLGYKNAVFHPLLSTCESNILFWIFPR